ncbi:MAG: hypothetical protein EXX96DRAFT_551747 [Benjaminiella poitrasii]|nr:MAG: hypothetical protein EXX96DRAFT_551747 [Benjaminiella poitrasii]
MTGSIINFPACNNTSKLSSNLLKKPPTPVNWIQQTYMEMIQDVSYVTECYHKSSGSCPSLSVNIKRVSSNSRYVQNKAANNVLVINNRQQQEIQNHETRIKHTASSIYTNDSTSLSLYQQQRYDSNHENNKNANLDTKEFEAFNMKDDNEDNSEVFNTITTSSTECNRKYNIFTIYREHQKKLEQPTGYDEAPIIKIVESCNNKYDNFRSVDGYYTNNTTTSDSKIESRIVDKVNHLGCVSQTGKLGIANQTSKKRKKRLKAFNDLAFKMRMTVEKRFWFIENIFKL